MSLSIDIVNVLNTANRLILKHFEPETEIRFTSQFEAKINIICNS
jgi:hypothetical protein